MKTKRRQYTIAIILCLLLVQIKGVQAKEAQKEVKVERNFSQDETFTMEVRVKKGGCVIDGKASILEGIVAYQLPLETKKIFQVQSNSGYELKDIRYEQPELDIEYSILDQIKNNSVAIQTVSTKIIITVEFVQKQREEIVPIIPETGEGRQVAIWTIHMMGAWIAIILIKRKKQQETYHA